MLREQRNLEGSAHTGPDFKKSSKNYDFLLEIEPVMCYIMPQKVFLKKQKNPGKIRIIPETGFFSRKFSKSKGFIPFAF